MVEIIKMPSWFPLVLQANNKLTPTLKEDTEYELKLSRCEAKHISNGKMLPSLHFIKNPAGKISFSKQEH